MAVRIRVNSIPINPREKPSEQKINGVAMERVIEEAWVKLNVFG